jgi:hypothetical protein
MAARALQTPPRLLPLFGRSAISMLPGGSLLPFVPGGGKDVPDVELLLAGVRVDPARVAAYAKLCGFTLRHELPITYPHVLAFPLQMAVMADGSFPFGAVGLVHVENRIVQRSRIPIGQELSIRVKAGALTPHRRGRTFTLHTEVSADGQLVWEDFSTMLRRRGGSGASGGGGASAAGDEPAASAATATADGAATDAAGASDDQAGNAGAPAARETDAPALPTVATWRLPGDLGRRYAAVSGDSNPIHMHPLGARLFGFSGAIAHGMWSKARCLAALESRLSEACDARVSFRKPIVLPAHVQFASSPPSDDGETIEFALRDAKRGAPHLDGAVAPLQHTDERSTAK